jgi:uncharacterized protein (DUF362 family)
MSVEKKSLSARAVYISRAPVADYAQCQGPALPELAPPFNMTPSLLALRGALHAAGLDNERYGTPDWNPLGEIIHKGQKVLLKPNWVMHENHSGKGLDCLLTHGSLIEAVLRYVVKAKPGSIIVGDAPIQGCDFNALIDGCGMKRILEQFHGTAPEISLRDFRCVTLPGGKIHQQKQASDRGLDEYVLFDLGKDSLLEPITEKQGAFRVTMYDPKALNRTHGPGRHQYLVAREAIDADVVINMPKLKTHKKAGMTGAIKNMVGMNGHKEYLPHHRKGGAVRGGDCYGQASITKTWAEKFFDWANSTALNWAKYLFSRSGAAMLRLNKHFGGNGDVEGSWHGNDTVWRMCLDLQRILHYGKLDGTLADAHQRTILNVTDAIVAGEGEGPLSPEPVPLGVITFGTNVAAVDWIHAILMGFDPRKIPLVRESFATISYKMADFSPEDIQVYVDGVLCETKQLPTGIGRNFRAPLGWKGHCELTAA